MEAIRTIRNVIEAEEFAITLADLLTDVLNGKDLKQATLEASEALGMRDLDYIV